MTYIPSASVYEKYVDFGTGSVVDNTLNISQTLCVTNHELQEGSITWVQGKYIHSIVIKRNLNWVKDLRKLFIFDSCKLVADPDSVFLIDPITCEIPPNESRLFTIRFR